MANPQPPPSPPLPASADSGGDVPVVDRMRQVGAELSSGLGGVLAALPGAPLRPNQLALCLKVNRAVSSRVLNATSRKDPLETLHLVPGPEPLRRLVRAAASQGIAPELADRAESAIAGFDRLIRLEAGTRPALDALISSSLPGARERFELASKYSIYKGMSQLKGVLAEHWLGTAVVWPSATDPARHDLTWVNGAAAMQRLRPGVTARFGYRHQGGGAAHGAGPEASEHQNELPDIESLEQFCVNPPAHLEAHRAGDAIHYLLPDDFLGPREVVDMFVVDHHPAAMKRYATDPDRPRNSLFVEPAMPVGTLVFDVILHDEAFPGSEPELVIFDTGYDGVANVNDRARDIDRMGIQESIEFLGQDMARVQAAELPRYRGMLTYLANRYGWNPARFRGYRVRIRYPVYGWQVSMSFRLPPEP
jgi:hypothetical protein